MIIDKQRFFSIGEVSKISKIPVSALRYYDDHEVIKAEYIDDITGYRYYTWDTISLLAILRIYKHLEFNLAEIKLILEKQDLDHLRQVFENKLKLFEERCEILAIKQISLQSWYNLITEAQRIQALAYPPTEMKWLPMQKMIACRPVHYKPNSLKHIVVNIDFTNNLLDQNLKDSLSYDALLIHYPSIEQRIREDMENCTIYIAPHPNSQGNWPLWGGFPVIASYHNGPYNTIKETYQRMIHWAEEHSFRLEGSIIERYIIDWWSSKNENEFVTQIFLPLTQELNIEEFHPNPDQVKS